MTSLERTTYQLSTRKKSWGGMEDDLEIFSPNSGNLGSPCEADEVKRYCKAGADLEAVRKGLGESGTKLIAWVDDRNSSDLTEREV